MTTASSPSLPHQPSVGVPLVASGPAIEPRGEVADVATILDLPVTFLAYAGVVPPAEMDSRSMRPYLAGETDEHREYVCSGLAGWRLAYDGRFKLITGYYTGSTAYKNMYEYYLEYNGDREAMLDAYEPRLYDVEAGETENVAEDHPDVLQDLTGELLPVDG